MWRVTLLYLWIERRSMPIKIIHEVVHQRSILFCFIWRKLVYQRKIYICFDLYGLFSIHYIIAIYFLEERKVATPIFSLFIFAPTSLSFYVWKSLLFTQLSSLFYPFKHIKPAFFFTLFVFTNNSYHTINKPYTT